MTLRLLTNEDRDNQIAWTKPSDPKYVGPLHFEIDDSDAETSDVEDSGGHTDNVDAGDLGPFTAALLSHLPNVREVSSCLPFPSQGAYDYCSNAPKEMCELLEIGHLDTVRFLYRGVEDDAPADCPYMKDILLPKPEWDISTGLAEHHALCKELEKKKKPRFVATYEKRYKDGAVQLESEWPWEWSKVVWALRRPSPTES